MKTTKKTTRSTASAQTTENSRPKMPTSSSPVEAESKPLALVENDPWLKPFEPQLHRRLRAIADAESRLTQGTISLSDFASGHEYYGLHREENGWVFREWAPSATEIFLIGEFSHWHKDGRFALTRLNERGDFEIRLPLDGLHHGDSYKLWIRCGDWVGERVPAWARRVIQDPVSHLMAAQVWDPPEPYVFRCRDFSPVAEAPRIYETHVGMALEDGRVGTFPEFTEHILPIIAEAGYNTIQLMAILEHPYYGSFGYHVTGFFAVSSRFGTPDEFKALVDRAHELGIAVVIDLVHSHAAKNEAEGLSRFDGTSYQYFHEGARGDHIAWDSRCFNYSRPEVLHFLLSNCRFWLDEYHVDGFRFDGVTSMLYRDHGLGKAFTQYADYFNENLDEEAQIYLGLANRVIHAVRSDAITIAEDVSGMPGLAAPLDSGGLGFDYRLAMGTPDYWIKLIKEFRDEDWNVGTLYRELTSRRPEEKTIGYAESHDQALVGDKAIFFRLVDAEIYTGMTKLSTSAVIDRGMALHKMIRLITLSTAGNGYLNFMGNEFGHPEWIDFPREGNGWSYHHARRQWHLKYDPLLRYSFLADFDREMMWLCRDNGLLDTADLEKIQEHISDQVLGFRRGDLYGVFNFNPTVSFNDYGIPVRPGEYELILDTDEGRFGGFDRIVHPQTFFSQECDPSHGDLRHFLRLYLPARTAVVLRRIIR